MTLDEIKAKFTTRMNRRDLTANTALVTDFIDQAIMRIQGDLRCPAMEKSVPVTIATGYTGLVIPSDFLELIQIIPAATNLSLRRCSISKALNLAQSTDNPVEYCRQGGQWILAPSPNVGDVVTIDYYAELTALTAGTDTNVITDIAWDLIVNAACAEAASWFIDKRAAGFEAKYQEILMRLQNQSDEDELNTAVMQPCYTFPSDEISDYVTVY